MGTDLGKLSLSLVDLISTRFLDTQDPSIHFPNRISPPNKISSGIFVETTGSD